MTETLTTDHTHPNKVSLDRWRSELEEIVKATVQFLLQNVVTRLPTRERTQRVEEKGYG